MWWRLTSRDFQRQSGEGNRNSLRRIVDSGEVAGLMAYHRGEPIGWCSVAPREAFPRLAHSRVLKPVDDKPVWSVVCFFAAKSFRRKGVSVELLEAAVTYAGKQGAEIIEGYPVEPQSGRTADIFAYTGLVSTFRKAGFVEVLRRSKTRPIMRRLTTNAQASDL
jgi:GNAT superfamily N-acetyltransferase